MGTYVHGHVPQESSRPDKANKANRANRADRLCAVLRTVPSTFSLADRYMAR